MYQALYRKWRSKTFDDVVGQDHITTTLKNQVAVGKPSHAYLFCGTRGTGKTSCSKILAKAVNCPNQKDGNPCCQCDICRGIDYDSILDVTEIDAASNSGVDNIRDLKEEANFTPAVTKYRVYIIDETHMLSTGAFNALLKIMEEPPPHVLFILATTEIHKVPATILSRCQRFDFHRIGSDSIAKHLLYIADEEQVQLEPDAAMLIARLSDGGMRDAISLLDLCLSDSGVVTAETVRDRAGLVGQAYLFDIAHDAQQEDPAAVLAVVQSLWEKSIDYQRLCEQLAVFYRNLMIVKSVRDPGELVSCLPEELEQYRIMAQELSMSRIFQCISVLQETLARMSRSSTRRTELEIGLIKLCNPALDTSPQALAARMDKLEAALKSRPATVAPHTPRGAEVSIQEAKSEIIADPVPEELEKAEVEPFDKWSDVLEILKLKNKALFGTLVDSTAYIGDDLLLVDAGDGLFAQMVRGDSYAKESLRNAMISVTGQKYRLGPYRPEKYRIKETGLGKLEDLLIRASDLGVDVQIKE